MLPYALWLLLFPDQNCCPIKKKKSCLHSQQLFCFLASPFLKSKDLTFWLIFFNIAVYLIRVIFLCGAFQLILSSSFQLTIFFFFTFNNPPPHQKTHKPKTPRNKTSHHGTWGIACHWNEQQWLSNYHKQFRSFSTDSQLIHSNCINFKHYKI